MRRLLPYLWWLEVGIAGSFLVVMVLLIFAGGIARMMAQPLNWTTDVATCLFAWACFLCADIAWRKNSLMSIDVLTERLPASLQKFCTYCNHAIIVCFLTYVIVAGVYLSWVSRARSFQGIPEISYSWVTMSMPVGGMLLLITAVLKIMEEIGRTGTEKPDLANIQMPT